MFRDKVFKKSLFGYSKMDVIDYLNVLSQEFSKRLLEQEENSKQEIANLKEKIIQLESDKKDLLDKQSTVADILMDAEKYNSFIKKTIEIEAYKRYDDFLIKAKNETERLKTYKKAIDDLRSISEAMLEKISQELEVANIEVDVVEIPTFEELLAKYNT